jgi:hypothetical protein
MYSIFSRMYPFQIRADVYRPSARIRCDDTRSTKTPRGTASPVPYSQLTGRGRQEGEARSSSQDSPHAHKTAAQRQGRTKNGRRWQAVVRGGGQNREGRKGAGSWRTTTTTADDYDDNREPSFFSREGAAMSQEEPLAVIRRILKATDRWRCPSNERRMLPRPAVAR